MKKVITVFFILAAIAVSFTLLHGDSPAPETQNATSPAPVHMVSEQQAGRAPNMLAGVISPFGNYQRKPAAELISQRRARMKSAGYMTPDEYFGFSLKELLEMAKKNDVLALMQLAERYYYEAEDLQFEDGYDFKVGPRTQGKAYYEQVANAGYNMAIKKVIALDIEDGALQSAYTWSLFAERLGQPVQAGLDWSKLSSEAKFRAQQNAEREYEKFLSKPPILIPGSTPGAST
ncbi:MAG TPA: hypothetical protein VGD52_13180 [Pseudoduganella sp.]